MLKLNILLFSLLALSAELAHAAPTITLGKADSYCVVLCYIRVPFTIANLESTQHTGRIICDLESAVTARLPVYNGETRTRIMQTTTIGVFAIAPGEIKGAVEMDTGIRKPYFVEGKVKSARCHL
jgi:hypothetical protein